jgi:hypothetical protein
VRGAPAGRRSRAPAPRASRPPRTLDVRSTGAPRAQAGRAPGGRRPSHPGHASRTRRTCVEGTRRAHRRRVRRVGSPAADHAAASLGVRRAPAPRRRARPPPRRAGRATHAASPASPPGRRRERATRGMARLGPDLRVRTSWAHLVGAPRGRRRWVMCVRCRVRRSRGPPRRAGPASRGPSPIASPRAGRVTARGPRGGPRGGPPAPTRGPAHVRRARVCSPRPTPSHAHRAIVGCGGVPRAPARVAVSAVTGRTTSAGDGATPAARGASHHPPACEAAGADERGPVRTTARPGARGRIRHRPHAAFPAPTSHRRTRVPLTFPPVEEYGLWVG